MTLTLGILVLLVVILLARLTSGWRWRPVSEYISPDDIPAEIFSVVQPDSLSGTETEMPGVNPGGPSGMAPVLLELMERLGADPQAARREMKSRGYRDVDAQTPARRERGPTEAGSKIARPGVRVVSARDDLAAVVERSLLVGIQVARIDDDHAGVADGGMVDALELQRHAEKAEQELFGEGRQQRLALCTKAVVVLQDLYQSAGDGEPERKSIVEGLIAGFERQLEAIQAEVDSALASLPDAGQLLWGDGADRRLYYFKMGVTNALRRSGFLDSLGHLYRLQGVNFDVEEAYDLASEEAGVLVLADAIGIERLVTMGPSQVHSLVHQHLSDGNS